MIFHEKEGCDGTSAGSRSNPRNRVDKRTAVKLRIHIFRFWGFVVPASGPGTAQIPP
jgi:hypothetical protein